MYISLLFVIPLKPSIPRGAVNLIKGLFEVPPLAAFALPFLAGCPADIQEIDFASNEKGGQQI